MVVVDRAVAVYREAALVAVRAHRVDARQALLEVRVDRRVRDLRGAPMGSGRHALLPTGTALVPAAKVCRLFWQHCMQPLSCHHALPLRAGTSSTTAVGGPHEQRRIRTASTRCSSMYERV